MNRFILNELICQKDEIKTEEIIEVNYAFTAEYLEKENNKFKYLYGDKGNDSKLEYKDLGDYLYYSDGIPLILIPLTLVICVNGAKDLYEDFKRKESDNKENNSKCEKYFLQFVVILRIIVSMRLNSNNGCELYGILLKIVVLKQSLQWWA